MGGVTQETTNLEKYVPENTEGDEQQEQSTETPTTAIPAGGEVTETKKEE
jgi:hypothetical protein